MNPRIVALIVPIQNRLNMISQSRACKKHLSRSGGSSGYAPFNQNNRQLRYPAGISGGTSAFNSQIENNEIGQSDTKNDVSNVLFRLTILRHGQTTANAKGIIQGQQVHWPLTDVGVMQARMAHEEFVRLANEKKNNFNYFWRAYSSDLFRAKHTAEIALGRDPKHPSSGVLMCQTEDLRLDERLREYSLGVREGRSVSISWQQAVSEWRKENNLDDERDESNWHQYMTTKAPSRESAKDVRRRTQSLLHNLVEEVREKWHSTKGASSTHQTLNNDPPNILLVSHGGCIKILLQSSLGFPEELIGKLHNGSLTEVDVLSSLSSDHDTKARTHDEYGKTVIYDGEVHCCYRLGSRVNDIRHLEDHPMGLTQHHGHENDSLDALYGALGDDASVAMEK